MIESACNAVLPLSEAQKAQMLSVYRPFIEELEAVLLDEVDCFRQHCQARSASLPSLNRVVASLTLLARCQPNPHQNFISIELDHQLVLALEAFNQYLKACPINSDESTLNALEGMLGQWDRIRHVVRNSSFLTTFQAARERLYALKQQRIPRTCEEWRDETQQSAQRLNDLWTEFEKRQQSYASHNNGSLVTDSTNLNTTTENTASPSI